MKHKLLILLGFLIMPGIVGAEHIYELLLPSEAQQLQVSLKGAKSNGVRVNLMLNLGFYYALKFNPSKAEIDSANRYAAQTLKIGSLMGLRKEVLRGKLLTALLCIGKGSEERFRQMTLAVISGASESNWLRLKGEALYFLGYFGPLTEQLELYQKALACFKATKSYREEAFMYKKMGETYTSTGNGNKEISLQMAMKSLELYQKINYPNLQYVYNQIGKISETMNNWPDRVKYVLLAIDASKKSKDTAMLAYYYSDLGGTYRGLGQYQDALKYLRLSDQIIRKDRNIIWVYHNAALISGIYRALNQREKGLDYFKSAVKQFPPVDLKQKLGIATYFTSYYCEIGQFELAAPYCAEMLRLEAEIRRMGQSPALSTTLKASSYYLGIRDYEKAIYYLDETAKVNVKRNSGYEQSVAYQRFRVDSSRGNWTGAIRHYQRYKAISDSIMNQTKLAQIAELQIRYETKKKENEILIKDKSIADLNQETMNLNQQAKIREYLLSQARLESQKSALLAQKRATDLQLNLKNISLLQQTSKLQQNSLEQASVAQKIVIAISVLLLIIITLLFRQYRQKQKSSRVITEKNNQLERLISEKNWLLKEVHHRVKNNLQTVISLLESQAFYLKDDALRAMENCQHRIYVMSLIHQKLYQSDEVKSIYMPSYISEFVSYLAESFEVRQRIYFEQEIGEIELNITQAVPLALIINEVVTNAIKYAFPNQRFGVIDLSLTAKENRITLQIKDNGIGIKDEQLGQNMTSLGLRLIKGLATDLEASIEISNLKGTTVTICFEQQHLILQKDEHPTFAASGVA